MASHPHSFNQHLRDSANGRRGGFAVAKKLGPEFCEERARKGGEAVKLKYGLDYYSKHVRKFVSKNGGFSPRTNLGIYIQPRESSQLLLGS